MTERAGVKVPTEDNLFYNDLHRKFNKWEDKEYGFAKYVFILQRKNISLIINGICFTCMIDYIEMQYVIENAIIKKCHSKTLTKNIEDNKMSFQKKATDLFWPKSNKEQNSYKAVDP